MSKSVRKKSDRIGQLEIFPTASWPVDRLLDYLKPEGGNWFEPCAGEGHIIRAVDAWFERTGRAGAVAWESSDIRPTRYAQPPCDMTRPDNYFTQKDSRFTTVISNPPFSRALELFLVLWPMCLRSLAFLLPMSFMGSEARTRVLRKHTPSLFILPERPVFDADNTDQETYSWFVWSRRQADSQGIVRVLPATPVAARRASEAAAFAEMPAEWHRDVEARKAERRARAKARKAQRALVG